MWKCRFFGVWPIFTKMRTYQKWISIKGRIFFWKKFTYCFFQISADLAGERPKIDISSPPNWFLGIFGYKNTKISIFPKMVLNMFRYQNLPENGFWRPQGLISTHISSWNIDLKTLGKIEFWRKMRFLAFFMIFWIFRFLTKYDQKWLKNWFGGRKNVFWVP